MNRKLTKSQVKALDQLANQPALVRSMIIKLQWNAEAPHFGGGMPHRYNGDDKFCSYCNRPKNWKPRNVFFNDDGSEAA